MKTLKELQKEFAAEKFGISSNEIRFYISGICYARAGVKTPESAKIISEKVNGFFVNGGWYDGMPLGRIDKRFDGDDTWYEVMC